MTPNALCMIVCCVAELSALGTPTSGTVSRSAPSLKEEVQTWPRLGRNFTTSVEFPKGPRQSLIPNVFKTKYAASVANHGKFSVSRAFEGSFLPAIQALIEIMD